MCHVTTLNAEEKDRLDRLPMEYRAKLEERLENGRDRFGQSIKSRRSAVKPIFEKVYRAWLEREAAIAAASALFEAERVCLAGVSASAE